MFNLRRKIRLPFRKIPNTSKPVRTANLRSRLPLCNFVYLQWDHGYRVFCTTFVRQVPGPMWLWTFLDEVCTRNSFVSKKSIYQIIFESCAKENIRQKHFEKRNLRTTSNLINWQFLFQTNISLIFSILFNLDICDFFRF